jgi:hypothetical protein
MTGQDLDPAPPYSPNAGRPRNEQRPAPGFNAVIGNARADGHAVIQSIAAQYNISKWKGRVNAFPLGISISVRRR